MRLQPKILASSLAIAVSTGAFLSNACAQTAAPNAITASFSGKTIAPSDTVSLTFTEAINAGDGQFAVVVGTEDLTANFRWVSPTQLDGVFAAMPLPSGTNTLKIFKIADGNQWQEIGQLEISVAAANTSGAKVPVFKPTLIVGIKSQLAEAHSATATPPARETYTDLTTQASLQTEHGDADWTLKSQLNVVGSSFRPEAVDYGNQLNNAPKLDVANYLVEASFKNQYGITSAGLGHIQAGNNPLLANGIGNRGLVLSHKFGERADISAAFQNGNAIVGGLNPFGLNDNEHRLNTVSAGFEVLERTGGLRLEATSFSGTIKPKLTTGVATLQDAEESRGYGLRAKAQNTEATLRADIAYARSTYTPKGDSILNILPGPATSGNSWYADVAYDLLKNAALSPDYPLSLTVQGKHEYASFGFKTLGVGAAPDFEANTLALNATLGVITSALQFTQRADNVNNNPVFLKNRSKGYNLTLGLPLAQVIDKAKPPLWAPTISFNHGRTHNYADTAFIPSGQTLANLSNVFATTQGMGLNWTVNKLTLGYQLTRSLQDNEQLGMERMDLSTTGHAVTTAYAATDKINLTGGIGQTGSLAKDTGVKRSGNSLQGGVNWLFGDRYTFTTNLSTSRDRDSLGTSDTKTLQANMQLLKQFDMTAFGMKLPGQWTLSYTHSNTNSLGIVVRYQTLNAALSLAFF